MLYKADLATSLDVLSRRLFDFERKELSLSVAEEAMGMYEQVLAERPFDGAIKKSFNSLSNRIRVLRPHEDVERHDAAEQTITSSEHDDR